MERSESKTTIYDISERAGVSIATVSRVLNNSSRVSDKTKEKVRRIMKESDYEPNAYARGLGTGTTKTIGILCADVADTYLANAVSFLERELRHNGFESILNCTGYDLKSKRNCMRQLLARQVDAIILVGSQYIELRDPDNDYIRAAAGQIPIMLLNGFLDGSNIYSNLCDDYGSFYSGTEMLIRNGMRDILFLYRDITFSRNQKYQGYAAALKDQGIQENSELIVGCGSYRMKVVMQTLLAEYEKGLRFDAVIACDDNLAMGALKFTQKKGIRVPEELQIIGCNNSVLSVASSPELTSIDNKCENLCINTVNTLMRVLEKTSVSRKIMLSSDIVIRETTREK